MQWLTEPVEHVRDIRSLFLLKLALISRAEMDPMPLLQAQRAVVTPAVEALQSRLATSAGSERVFVRFRLESTRAVIGFIDGLLSATPAAPKPLRCDSHSDGRRVGICRSCPPTAEMVGQLPVAGVERFQA